MSADDKPVENMTRRDLLAAAGATAVAAGAVGAFGAEAEGQGTASDNAGRKFNPNRLTFEQGIERIKKALPGASGVRTRITTSRDSGAAEVMKALRIQNIPGGFEKYQLPVYFQGGPGAQFFISVGQPNTKVPQHSHEEGDGLRLIVSGSIIYEGKELTAGDWMFIPKGTPYALEVGPLGAQMFYCYQCCCA